MSLIALNQPSASVFPLQSGGSAGSVVDCAPANRGQAAGIMAVPHPEQGSLRLFTFKGIKVFLHWSWLLVAVWQFSERKDAYETPAWAAAEYLALFGIVLLHEFGHAFATRQVGGRSENILLWPFGGIAYVNAPHRPGAHLWSIAAGPLVNVALVPVLWLLFHFGMPAGASKDAFRFAEIIQFINLVLLVFNLLPIYPMDGGQILQALLWFKLGFVKALLIASVAGLVGGVVLTGLLFWWNPSLFVVLIGLFLLSGAWKAYQAARQMQGDRPAHPS